MSALPTDATPATTPFFDNLAAALATKLNDADALAFIRDAALRERDPGEWRRRRDAALSRRGA